MVSNVFKNLPFYNGFECFQNSLQPLDFHNHNMGFILPCAFFPHHYFSILIVVGVILLQCCLQICYGIITFLQLLIKSLEFTVQQFFFCHQRLNFMFFVCDFHITPCNDFKSTLLSLYFSTCSIAWNSSTFFSNFEIFCSFSKPFLLHALSASSSLCWFTSFYFCLATS